MASIRSNGLFPRRWERSPEFEEEEEEEEEEVHVLAVDDSLVDRKVIERLLKITSCKVTTVESGWRALQYLGLDQDTPPLPLPNHDFVNGLKVDLIITDYCMPGMTGYELLKKIKGSATFREVPVVIMSSENVVARIDRCLEEGAEDFIVKPVKLSDVKRLKDYMFGDNRATIPPPTPTTNNNNNNNNREEDKPSFNKRKLQEMSDTTSSYSPSTSPSPPTMSPNSTSQQSPSTSSSSSSSSLSSTPPMSPPFSPSQLDFPTMRLKVTNSPSDQV